MSSPEGRHAESALSGAATTVFWCAHVEASVKSIDLQASEAPKSSQPQRNASGTPKNALRFKPASSSDLRCLSLILVLLPSSRSATACSQCSSTRENWRCLDCGGVFCGRSAQAHMVAHFKATGHCVVASFDDLSFWCFRCEAFVNHRLPRLSAAYAMLHMLKFGEPPVDHLLANAESRPTRFLDAAATVAEGAADVEMDTEIEASAPVRDVPSNSSLPPLESYGHASSATPSAAPSWDLAAKPSSLLDQIAVFQRVKQEQVTTEMLEDAPSPFWSAIKREDESTFTSASTSTLEPTVKLEHVAVKLEDEPMSAGASSILAPTPAIPSTASTKRKALDDLTNVSTAPPDPKRHFPGHSALRLVFLRGGGGDLHDAAYQLASSSPPTRAAIEYDDCPSPTSVDDRGFAQSVRQTIAQVRASVDDAVVEITGRKAQSVLTAQLGGHIRRLSQASLTSRYFDPLRTHRRHDYDGSIRVDASSFTLSDYTACQSGDAKLLVWYAHDALKQAGRTAAPTLFKHVIGEARFRVQLAKLNEWNKAPRPSDPNFVTDLGTISQSELLELRGPGGGTYTYPEFPTTVVFQRLEQGECLWTDGVNDCVLAIGLDPTNPDPRKRAILAHLSWRCDRDELARQVAEHATQFQRWCLHTNQPSLFAEGIRLLLQAARAHLHDAEPVSIIAPDHVVTEHGWPRKGQTIPYLRVYYNPLDKSFADIQLRTTAIVVDVAKSRLCLATVS